MDGTVIQACDVQIYISSVCLAVDRDIQRKQYRVINGDPNIYDGVTNVVFIVQGRTPP